MKKFPLMLLFALVACSPHPVETSYPEELTPFQALLDTINTDSIYYAVVDLGAPALLLTEYVYDSEMDENVTIMMNIYSKADDGNVISQGEMNSQGTAYPFTSFNGMLYRAGHHFIEKYHLINDKLTCVENGLEEYDHSEEIASFEEHEEKATYYYQIGEEEPIQNDSLFNKLMNECFDSPVITFKKLVK